VTIEKLKYQNSAFVRNSLNSAIDKADQIHYLESELVPLLKDIDEKRLYTRSGQKSLRGFCNGVLRFSKTQSQRIATLVRRYEPTANIGKKRDGIDG
jgi:hypothetical protein